MNVITILFFRIRVVDSYISKSVRHDYGARNIIKKHISEEIFFPFHLVTIKKFEIQS